MDICNFIENFNQNYFNMPFSISVDQQNNTIIGTFSGILDRELLRQYTLEMDKIRESLGVYHSLTDYRECTITFSTMDLFYLPDKHGDLLESLGGNVHKLKRAIVVNSRQLEKAKFFENVATNRGQRVRVFTDEKEAIAWLK
jgi:hypothetical protein